MKIKKNIKNFKANKRYVFLYFFIPLILSSGLIYVERQNDIWFLLNHGKYVLYHGFPTTDPFSMHQGLHFVMQQWLSAVIFYISHTIHSTYGFFIICFIINCLILFFLYKLCMQLSNNYIISTFISITINILLLLLGFITPRPQIFTYLLLIMTLYIMEKFYKNKKTKAIYFLLLIAMLQINLHASMYFMLYIFMLPYLANYIYLRIKDKKDNRVFKLLLIWLMMFAVAFINPYGIKAITYVFNSYGNFYINNYVYEMKFVTFDNMVGKIFYVLVFICLTIFIYFRKYKLEFRHYLLFFGLLFLGIQHYRNIPLWIIGGLPIISNFMNNSHSTCKSNKINITHNYIIIDLIFLAITSIFIITYQAGPKFFMEKGFNELLKNNDPKNIVLYTDYNAGAYAEYRGLKPYIDARAEVFLKDNNKSEDIFKEWYFLQIGKLDYKKFIQKYNFNFLIISKDDFLFDKISNDKNFYCIYKNKKYKIFKNLM